MLQVGRESGTTLFGCSFRPFRPGSPQSPGQYDLASTYSVETESDHTESAKTTSRSSGSISSVRRAACDYYEGKAYSIIVCLPDVGRCSALRFCSLHPANPAVKCLKSRRVSSFSRLEYHQVRESYPDSKASRAPSNLSASLLAP